jgi:hypothetical protein
MHRLIIGDTGKVESLIEYLRRAKDVAEKTSLFINNMIDVYCQRYLELQLVGQWCDSGMTVI